MRYTMWLTYDGFAFAKVVCLHPSCGLVNQPDWVVFSEFVLTTRPYIRMVSEVQVRWYVVLSFIAKVKTECGLLYLWLEKAQ